MRAPLHSFDRLLVALLAGVWACESGTARRTTGDSLPNVASNASENTQATEGVTTARRPISGCDWVPVAEVEAVLGPLAGAPSGQERSCRYPLPMDSATARNRERYREFLGDEAAERRDLDLDKVAVIVTIDFYGDVTHERAGRIAGAMLGSMFAEASGASAPPADKVRERDEPAPPEGWDVASIPKRNRDFTGRIGHLTIKVEENVVTEEAVPAEKKAALAALVRDRIPDLPFPVQRIDDAPMPPPTGPDPCSLLTRDEAESVLGKLVVPPYRSHDGGPLAARNGSSCAYFTSGHRVLVVRPHWTDGKQDLALIRGVGGIVSALASDDEAAAADTLDGPWDDVTLGLDGNLAFLRGDRLLEIAFATSSTDYSGALTLARIALDRLAAADTR